MSELRRKGKEKKEHEEAAQGEQDLQTPPPQQQTPPPQQQTTPVLKLELEPTPPPQQQTPPPQQQTTSAVKLELEPTPPKTTPPPQQQTTPALKLELKPTPPKKKPRPQGTPCKQQALGKKEIDKAAPQAFWDFDQHKAFMKEEGVTIFAEPDSLEPETPAMGDEMK